MAFTVANTNKTILGDHRLFVFSCTADAATQAINTGLKNVTYAWIQAQSFTSTGSRNLRFNANASAVAAAGYVGISGCVAGDVFTLFAMGY